ncbi:hypothetical protein MHU86_12188 [Fragilaria crotonensis]|nr:hypothetical protein MHU86_12188 [Fragilaria crotonensis]
MTDTRVSKVIPRTPEKEQDRADRGPGSSIPKELPPPIPNAVIDAETKRRAAERQAAIARGVQPNNTMPSVGFDNTFQNGETISTLGFDNTFQNEDSLTINSLNAFLDAPMSGTAENSLGRNVPDQPNSAGAGGGAVEPDVDDPEIQFGGAPIVSIGPAMDKEPSTGKQQEPKFGLFRRNHKTSKSQQKKGTTTATRATVDRFMPTTIAPVGDDELDAIDPEIQQQLVHIQDIERVTGDRLQAALQRTQAAAKANIAMARRNGDGTFGQSGINDPTTRGVFYRDPTTVQPEFVDAPIIPPGILTQKSWEDLADGASLASVTSLPDQRTEKEVPIIVPERASSFAHRKRFGLFRRKTTSRTPRLPRATESSSQRKKQSEKESKDIVSPASWQEVVARDATAATSGEDPADDHGFNVTVLNGNDDDNSSPTAAYGERDRYAVLVDDQEGQAIVDNDREANDVVNPPVLGVAPKGIRGAFSWDAGKHSESISGAKPSFVEVDGEDEAKVVLANKEEVLESIQAPVRVQPSEDIKTIRSMTNDAEISPSASFVEQMAEAKEANAKQRAGAAATTPSPGRKKGLYSRWRTRPAQI